MSNIFHELSAKIASVAFMRGRIAELKPGEDASKELKFFYNAGIVHSEQILSASHGVAAAHDVDLARAAIVSLDALLPALEESWRALTEAKEKRIITL